MMTSEPDGKGCDVKTLELLTSQREKKKAEEGILKTASFMASRPFSAPSKQC